jgi:sigma-E factor negative regulatory protein RseA
MSQAKREQQLSILMDDELDRDEMERSLNDLSGDRELRALWDRYHLIGDALRGEPLSRETMRVADRVRERLSDEPMVLVPRTRRIPRRWLTPLAGSALAASVALVALVAGPGWFEIGDLAPVQLAKKPSPAPTLYRDRTGTYWSLRRPEVESKLNSFLVNHQEYTPASGMKGVVPHVTFASYDYRR